jgi:hypothetical protein
MRKINLWAIPAGLTFGMFLSFNLGVTISTAMLVIFIVAFILCAILSIDRMLNYMPKLYETAQDFRFKSVYFVLKDGRLSTDSKEKCHCCKSKSDSLIILESAIDNTCDDVKVCLYCYTKIKRLWRKAGIDELKMK